MKDNNGRQEYGIFLNNSDLKAKVNESRNMFNSIGDKAVAESSRIDVAYRKATVAATDFFSVAAIKQFGTELINIRGQFQTFEAVLTNTLQSPTKAKGAMDMLQNFAATTPFQVDALTGAFVKLANQGFVPTYAEMEKLGDLASSTGKGFDQLAEAVIDAQTGEFERLKEFGIHANKEGDKVTFTFKEQATQVDFTASSIRNYILSLGELKGVQGANAEIAKTLTGQMSNLQDGITQMMNEIGQSSEGVLSGVLSGASYLVKHYEEVGRVLGVLITTYGAYKAAVIAVSVTQKLIAASGNVRAWFELAKGINTAKDAQVALNLAMGTNPILKIVSLLIAAGTAMYMFGSNANKVKDVTGELNSELTVENSKIDILFNRYENATKGTKEYENSKKAILDNYGQYLQGLSSEISSLNDVKGAYDAVKKAARESLIERLRTSKLEEAGKTAQDGFSAAYDEIFDNLKNKFKDGKKDLANTVMPIIREALEAENTTVLSDTEAAYNRVSSALQKTFGQQGGISVFNSISGGLRDWLNTSTKWKDELSEIDAKLAPIEKKLNEDDVDSSKETVLARRIRETKELADEQRKLNEMTANNSTSTKAEIEAQQKIVQTLKQSLGVDRKDGSDTRKDYTSDLSRQAQEKIRLDVSLANEVEQARIDLMDEGLAKVLAQNKLNFDKEIAQLEQQKKDKLTKIQEWERTIWESENPNWEKEGRTFAPETRQLPVAEQKQFEVIESSASKTLEAKNKQAYETALNDYAAFARAYIDKVNEFEQDIKNLNDRHQESRNNLVASGTSKEAIDQFDQKAQKEVDIVKGVHQDLLTGLDEQMEMKNQSFLVFAEQIANMGIEELKLKLEEAEQLLTDAAATAGDKGDKSSVVQYQAQIKALKQQIVALSKKDDNKDKKEADDPLKKYKATLKAVKEIGGMAKDISDAFQGLDGDVFEVMDSIGSMSSSISTFMEYLISMAATSQITIAGTTAVANTGVVATSTAASTAIQGVEKASVILAIIGAALQIVTAIAKTVSGLFNNDGKKEAEIQRLQEQVDTLEVSYEKLGKAIDKAYSANAATLIEQQDANLKQQKKLLEEQIRLEEEKKDTDDGKVDQYRATIKKIDDELEQTRDKTIEAIIGEDVKSAIEQFAEAYTDAWAAGEDKAASMKDVVRKMVRSAINELVKSRLSPEVDAFMGYLAKAMEDGILTIAEQKTLDSLENSIYNKLNGLDSSLDKYVTDKEEDRTASGKGFSSMDQDTGNELNGRFTAMQGMLFDVKEAQAQMLAVQKLNLPLLQNLTHLTAISENTAYCRRLEGIEKDMNTMKSDMNIIVTRGIKILK